MKGLGLSVFGLMLFAFSGSAKADSPFGCPFPDSSQGIVEVKSLVTAIQNGNGMQISLCGGNSCCAISINGFFNNTLAGSSQTLQSSNTGRSTSSYSTTMNQYSGTQLWSPGDLRLIVQHRYSLLGVWLENSAANNKMWVQCPVDAKFLFLIAGNVGSSSLIQPSGDGREGTRRVPPGPILQPGEVVALDVTTAYSFSGYDFLSIGLCGLSSCAAVQLKTYPQNGIYPFKSGLTSINEPQTPITTVLQDQRPSSYRTDYAWNFIVNVALHPDQFLQVWTPSDPTQLMAAIPVPDELWNGEAALRINFGQGYVNFTSQGIQELHSLPDPHENFKAKLPAGSKDEQL